MLDFVPTEVKLLGSAIGVYTSFLNWGYLQERLASTDYSTTVTSISDDDGEKEEARWTYVIVLNCCMASMCCLTALPFLLLSKSTTPTPTVTEANKKKTEDKKRQESSPQSSSTPNLELALPSLSHSLASPFGYLSLRYINYPMLLLVKSSKLVPVMLLSYLLNGKRYSMIQITSVALISIGVALFSCKIHPVALLSGDSASKDNTDDSAPFKAAIGFALVSINLLLDGFTNARQDKYRDVHTNVSSFYLMYQTNIWQVMYMSSYLTLTTILSRFSTDIISTSQVDEAIAFMIKYPPVIKDILLFSLCGATGQVFIFYIITSFGSLMCVLITVTRKFFSILISVVMFGHLVQWWQWCGVGCVFSGLLMNSLDKYRSKKKKDDQETKKKTE